MKTERTYRNWKKMMEIGRKVFRCHQLPERSFFVKGYQFPLCARCTGILCGAVLSFPVSLLLWRENGILSAVLIGLMVADGTVQYCTKYRSTNPRRLLTGLGAGYGAVQLLIRFADILISGFRL